MNKRKLISTNKNDYVSKTKNTHTTYYSFKNLRLRKLNHFKNTLSKINNTLTKHFQKTTIWKINIVKVRKIQSGGTAYYCKPLGAPGLPDFEDANRGSPNAKGLQKLAFQLEETTAQRMPPDCEHT